MPKSSALFFKTVDKLFDFKFSCAFTSYGKNFFTLNNKINFCSGIFVCVIIKFVFANQEVSESDSIFFISPDSVLKLLILKNYFHSSPNLPFRNTKYKSHLPVFQVPFPEFRRFSPSSYCFVRRLHFPKP